jgi:hypothetical protein
MEEAVEIAPPDCSRAAGVLRRAIEIVAGPGEVRAAIEDDYHHFRIAVSHEGAKVTGVRSQGIRIPWTACAFAGEDWSAFVGLPLPRRSSSIGQTLAMSAFCTHMYEVAALAMAAVARGVTRRRYDVAVPYGERRSEPATLVCDGALVLSWITDNGAIQLLRPERFGGVNLRARFAAWAAANLDEEEGDAALVLRRAIVISSGRTTNLDARRGARGGGVCYTNQPEQAVTAVRVVGSTHDFEMRPQALLSSDRAWLDFETAR